MRRLTLAPRLCFNKGLIEREANMDYEQATALLRYDEETGLLWWKKPGIKRILWRPAGHKDRHGYIRIMVDYKMYLAHRVIWLLNYGEWPKDQLDHIDRDTSNNRLNNLRDVSNSINQRCAKTKYHTGSGERGITVNACGTVSLRLQGKTIGTYNTLREARQAKEEHNEEVYPHRGTTSNS